MSSLNKLLYSEDSSIPILEKKILLKYILNTSNEEINISHDKLLDHIELGLYKDCLLYTSPSPRDRTRSRMPSSA